MIFCWLQKAFIVINFDYSSYSLDNKKQFQKFYHNDFDIQKNCFSRLIHSRISTNRSHFQSINFDKRKSTCNRRFNNCQFSIFSNTCWRQISFFLFFEMISKRENLSQRFKSISTWYCWFSTNDNFSKLFCAFWNRFNIWKLYVVNNFSTFYVAIYFFRRVNICTIKCFNQFEISTSQRFEISNAIYCFFVVEKSKFNVHFSRSFYVFRFQLFFDHKFWRFEIVENHSLYDETKLFFCRSYDWHVIVNSF